MRKDKDNQMTKQLFTFSDSWPWLSLAVAAIAACVLVAFSKDAQAFHGVITFAASGGILGAVALHFWRRWKVVDAWNRAPKLWPGIALLGDNSSDSAMDLDGYPELMAVKWSQYRAGLADNRTNPERFKAIIDALRGCDITFTAEPWTHNGVLVGGIQDGEHITVVGPDYAGIERTRALIIHELSHRALTALGIPPGPDGEDHHKIFEQEGLGC